LAIQYCNIMVNTPAAVATVLPGIVINDQLYANSTSTGQVTSALAARVLGSGTQLHQPAASTITTELNQLISNLCSSSACNGNLARVQSVTAAACATAFGSADMLIY
jgi:hypothetical protein